MPAVRAEINKQIARRTDYKACDRNSLIVAASQTGVVYDPLLSMAIGDLALNDYEGDTIFPSSFQVNYTLFNTDNSAVHSMRVIIGQSHMEFIPPSSELLQQNGTAQVGVMPNNLSYSRNHKIFHDKTWNLKPVGSGGSSVDHRVYISGKRMRKIQFSATTSGSVTRNGIFIAI